jgi:hypothetical protein
LNLAYGVDIADLTDRTLPRERADLGRLHLPRLEVSQTTGCVLRLRQGRCGLLKDVRGLSRALA